MRMLETKRHAVVMLAAAAVTGGLAYAADPVTTDTHTITEVRNGIWLAQTTAPLFNSNSLVIVNDDDVVVVDSHITPAKARDLIASIGVLTPKPVTALINSHFHFDHSDGNQAFTGVPIVGHEYTRMKMAGTPLEEPTWVNTLAGNRARLERLEEQVAAEENGEKKSELQAQLEMFAAHAKGFEEVDPVPPDLTLNRRMTLFRGDREIQIVFLGRAHTGGDLAVYFPQDRLVFTGDMALGGPSYLGDGFVDEWPQTLENLKALDFDVFVPGHGPPVTDRGRIDLVQAYYRDLWKKVAAKHGAGVSAEEAAPTIDMTNHTAIPIQNVGVGLADVARIYHRLDNPDAE